MRFSKTRCKGTVFSAVKGFILICFPAVLTKFRNLTIKSHCSNACERNLYNIFASKSDFL